MLNGNKGARRYNSGKLRYELISPIALAELARVYTLGAEKYTLRDEKGNIIDDGSDNWKKGLPWMDTIASVQRHIEAWKQGESIDPDLGSKHLANAAWGLFALLEYEKTHPELDNRNHGYLKPKKRGLDIDGVLANFDKHFCAYSGIDCFDPTHWNDPIFREHFEKIKGNEDFWSTIPVLNPPSSIGFEPHCYITSRSIDPKVTQKWLDVNGFPSALLYCVKFNESKVQAAKEAGVEIFIDDKFENFVELNNAGICTFLYDAPHNRKYSVGYKRIFKINDIL